MIVIETEEQMKRVAQAKRETEQLIQNEMQYSPQHRKQEALSFLHDHLENLEIALQTWHNQRY